MKKIVSWMLALGFVFSGMSAMAFDAGSEITVVSREDGSGTRGAFVELLGVEQKDESGKKIDNTTEEAIITNNTAVMMTTVAGDENAIGYISLGSLNDSVKALAVDGVGPSVETIKSGEYKIARPFNIATKAEVSELAGNFIEFILSAEGQAVVSGSGYIALDTTVPFGGIKGEGKLVVAGSSSVTPVMEKLKEAYQALNAGATVEIQQSDSTTGLSAAATGVCDIGMASRELKDSELEQGLVASVIAMDGIALIVNNENPMENIASEQARAVFTGEITTWADVQ